MDADVFHDLWHRRHGLTFKLAVSYRYHRKRQRFFDLVDKATKAATVLAGASLLGETVKNNLPLAAAVISSLGLVSLVFGYGDRKQAHKEMAESFMHLQAKVDEAGLTDFTAAQLAQWEAECSRLDAREPPDLQALVTICQNEQATATGNAAHVYPLPLHQRLLASLVSCSISR